MPRSRLIIHPSSRAPSCRAMARPPAGPVKSARVLPSPAYSVMGSGLPPASCAYGPTPMLSACRTNDAASPSSGADGASAACTIAGNMATYHSASTTPAPRIGFGSGQVSIGIDRALHADDGVGLQRDPVVVAHDRAAQDGELHVDVRRIEEAIALDELGVTAQHEVDERDDQRIVVLHADLEQVGILDVHATGSGRPVAEGEVVAGKRTLAVVLRLGEIIPRLPGRTDDADFGIEQQVGT